MELYLLRHGRSTANEQGLVTGDKDDSLCPKGLVQAQAAARLIKLLKLDDPSFKFFVSDWYRARETAALAAPDCDFIVDARLGETFAGTAANMALSAFNETSPQFWDSFDPERPYPDGESHRDLYERVCGWLAELESTLTHDAKILAVTHAGPICCLLQAACETPLSRFPLFIAANGSLTKLEKQENGFWRPIFFSLLPEAAL